MPTIVPNKFAHYAETVSELEVEIERNENACEKFSANDFAHIQSRFMLLLQKSEFSQWIQRSGAFCVEKSIKRKKGKKWKGKSPI